MRTTLWVIAGVLTCAAHGYACSVSRLALNTELVKNADMIVRAKAVEYAVAPGNPSMRTTGVPDSKVRFKVVERISGPEIPEVQLPGYLVDDDDFNEQTPPYTFVRPGGRSGSCFANSYRTGGEFLLFLKKTNTGEMTVNWAALAPVNEQLHSDRDPWLVWVRKHATADEPKVPKK